MILSDLVRINETSFYSLIWHWFYARFCHPPYPGVPWWASNSRTWSLSTINAREKMRRVTKQVWTRLERTDWGSKITLTIVHFFLFCHRGLPSSCFFAYLFLHVFVNLKAYKWCSFKFVMLNEHVANVSSSGTTAKKCGSSPQSPNNWLFEEKSRQAKYVVHFNFLFSICFRQNDDFHFDY